MATVYFARWMLLDTGEILENGAVCVEKNIILSAGPRSGMKRSSSDRLVNLGDTLMLPGFINMHTHLEECVVRGATRQADETFAAFIAKKSSRLRQAAPERITAGIRLTVRELLAEGITTVLDSSRLGWSAPVLAGEPIRSLVVHEAYAEDPAQEESLDAVMLDRIRSCDPRIGRGCGPHAIYSLSPFSQRKLVETAASRGWLWATHIAESAEELQAFSERKGDLYFYITRRKPWLFGMTTMGSMNLALTANLIPKNGICFHCNYASGHELSLLAAKRAAVVHCFRYSEALGHKRFPLEVALNRHLLFCLGTEGIAPAGAMSLLDELFALKCAYPHLPASEMLRWITQNAANALRMGDSLGSLTQGKFADFIAVRFTHDPREDILEELIQADVEMALVMVDGQEVIADY
ncbi:MAG: amidohydrolase family protein [Chitinispirillaceae bacterium]|nr:amidohydrolase family protein [Chitinispirillaceae bacterium]